MGYTPLGSQSQQDDQPRDYVNPPQMINHLLLIWPIRYEQNTFTKYPRQDGRPSDAVYLDVVDLSLADEQGYAGKVMRQAKWTQGRLIRDTKGACGTPAPMLVQMGKDGDAYILIEQSHNPGSTQLADAWLAAHPDFRPSDPVPLNQQQPPVPQITLRDVLPQAEYTEHRAAPVTPQPVAAPSNESVVMDRLKRQAQGNYKAEQPLPPPPPPARMQDEEPPF
jgi:hypothetical protein